MAAALSETRRHAHMAYAIGKNLPRLAPSPMGDESISLACYGPSLEDTWQNLKPPIISVSGAHDFLVKRGVIPTYHIDIDPRKHKLRHLQNPNDETIYLMASVCHPWVWNMLKGRRVVMWHTISGKQTENWLSMFDPGSTLIYGGSAVGLAAIQVAGFIGYRHIEIHGMDGSFRDGKRHAGEHYGHKQEEVDHTADGKTFRTTKIMMNSNVELMNVLHSFPVFCVFHGDGLVQSMVAESKKLPNASVVSDVEKTAKVRSAKYIEVATEKAA